MAELIYRWYKRSRLTYFNSAAKEAQEERNETELMKKAFGDPFTKDQIDRIIELSNCIDSLIVKPK